MTTIQETVPEEISTFNGQAGYEQYLTLLNNADFSNYTNSDDKVNIYIFRGDTCWHCLDEISYLTSKIDEIGEYANIYTYEVYKNTLSLTLLRSVGIIANPDNPSRSTPAGPPIEVPEAQQLGYNIAEFAVGFFAPELYDSYIKEYLSSNM